MEQRVDEDTDVLITKAATMLGESVSQFVVRSARSEASRVLARSDLTMMPAEQFDAMIAALEQPARTIPALVTAADRPRLYKRA
jgi:uncharacterized protein (DUF1778 family)